MKTLLALLLLAALCFADVTLVSPVELVVSDVDHSDYTNHITYLEDTFLGKIAPGQSLELTFSRRADQTFEWDKVEFVSNTFEPVITMTGTNLNAKIQLPVDIPESIYPITLKFTNDLNLRTPEVVTFKIQVTKDLYTFLVPSDAEVTAGVAETIPLEINSESISTDNLILGDFENFPAAWSHSGTIQIRKGETKNVSFNIKALDEGVYDLKFQLSSTSGVVLGQKEFKLRVYPSLKAKFQLYSEGFAFVPAILQPFYSVLSWFEMLF